MEEMGRTCSTYEKDEKCVKFWLEMKSTGF
jgi:hypothetical protein